MELLFLGLLGAAGLLGLAELFDGDDADDVQPEPPLPPDDLDTGATVVEADDGSINIELGEDETGSLTAIKFVQTSFGENWDQVYELDLYLVPEGVEVPADPTGAALTDYDTRVALPPPEITANAPIDIIRLHYGYSDGGLTDPQPMHSEPDETFSPFEEAGSYYKGVLAIETTDGFAGTDATDFVIAEGPEGTAGVSLSGLGGKDFLLTTLADSTLEGGDGKDILLAPYGESTVHGGARADRIAVGANSVAHGGFGHDDLSSTVGTGGDGDDHFGVNEHFDDIEETVVLTGGARADQYDIATRSLLSVNAGEAAEIVHITDFNPAEDVINVSIGYATTIVGSHVEEAADGSYSNLIVELRGDRFEDGDESSSIVIRLDGVTGYTAAQLLA